MMWTTTDFGASAATILSLKTAEPSLHDLMRLTASGCGVLMPEFISARRDPKLVRARHIYFALAREFTSKSFPMIGYYCGDRDHSTVMHGVQKVALTPEKFEPELGLLRRTIERCTAEQKKLILGISKGSP